MKVVRIACQGSPLAVAQAHMVMQAIRDYDPLLVPELLTLPIGQNEVPANILFYRLARALEDSTVDLCVHSLRNMPVQDNPNFPIVAVGHREDCRYVMVLPRNHTQPDISRPIGCFGVRLKMQLNGLFPGWRVEQSPEDVVAALDKLDSGEYGALVTSADGLVYLRLQERFYQAFSISQIIPEWGQGIVTVQGRAGERTAYLSRLHSVDCWDMALAERAFAQVLGNALMAANAVVSEDKITIHGMLVSSNGKMWEGVLSGKREDAAQIGAALAAHLRLDASGPIIRKRYDD